MQVDSSRFHWQQMSSMTTATPSEETGMKEVWVAHEAVAHEVRRTTWTEEMVKAWLAELAGPTIYTQLKRERAG